MAGGPSAKSLPRHRLNVCLGLLAMDFTPVSSDRGTPARYGPPREYLNTLSMMVWSVLVQITLPAFLRVTGYRYRCSNQIVESNRRNSGEAVGYRDKIRP